MTALPKLALLGAYCLEAEPLLRSALTSDWNVQCWTPDDDDKRLASTIENASATVVGADALLSGRIFNTIKNAEGLDLFQLPFSGHEWLRKSMLPEGCAACNIYAHGSTIAEYIMAAMLKFEIDLSVIDADFRTGSWRYAGSAGVGERHGELSGKTLGIVGYGNIGQNIAKRASAFGMEVIATARTAKTSPEPLKWLGGNDDLDELLGRSDYVVLACPANEETAGLIDTRRLESMKSSGVLVNVARSQLIVEEDLFNALKNGLIAGAVLDTWYHYPTPEDPQPKPANLPFETLSNVVMTPHCAAWSEAHHRRRWAKVAENLDRYVAGKKLRDQIF